MAKNTDMFGAPLPEVVKITPEQRRLAAAFNQFTIEQLQGFWRSLTGQTYKGGPKAQACLALASSLHFRSQEEFERFFATLPEYLREAIRIGAFYRFVDVGPLEKKYSVKLIVLTERDHYYRQHIPDKTTRMELFAAVDEYTLLLPPVFSAIFAHWLPKPPGYDPVPATDAGGEFWSNVEAVSEAIPLLAEAAVDLLKGGDRYELARKGLLKANIKKIRASCGQKEFPVAGKYSLDSIELFVRYLACMGAGWPGRPENSEDYLKDLTQRFFRGEQGKTSYFLQGGGELEYLALTDHLNHRQGSGNDPATLPPSRLSFFKVLEWIAVTQEWYAVDALLSYILLRGEPFSFCDPYTEQEVLYLKADTFIFNNHTFDSDPYERGFAAGGRMRDEILVRPLFQAYCYLMALFGVLEIREAEPEKLVMKNGKALPTSPYAAVTQIRLTDLGAWILGFRTEKPERAATIFEAIADKELLLVTFKGKSLERRLFLERVADPLGEERYRVTEASFVRTCEKMADIDALIAKFRTLIDPRPSERWENFFAAIKRRAGLFSDSEPALLFTFSGNSRSAESIIQDPQLRALLLRTEGNRVVVRSKDHKKFLKALKERGFLNDE